jgi:hypothetical protein
MNKRARIHAKYGGRCAYTGQPLGDDWQIDHATPKGLIGLTDFDSPNVDENLLPCCRIINHYKREQTVEQFRQYIAGLQGRIKNYHKRDGTYRKGKERQCKYLQRVADLFGITEDKPFSGKFYFERIKDE